MSLISFIEQYPDEESCRAKYKKMRDQEGVICKHCGSKEHYWLAPRQQYQCKKCRFRTGLRSGTVMEASKLPFRYWFIAMHLLTSTKKSFSSLEMQRQLGHKYYEPVWFMMQKIRKAMGQRDNNYKLSEIVELDEGFFESVDTEKKDQDQDDKKKRGRGSQKQSKVLVMASVDYSKKQKKHHNKPSKLRYVKMIILDNLQGETINKQVENNIDSESAVKTDNYKGYSKLKDKVWCHIPTTTPPKDADKVLPWVHTMISNAKRTLLGIHHMISKKYMQDYLDEFCYKVNRRYFGEQLFERLLIASVTTKCKI